MGRDVRVPCERVAPCVYRIPKSGAMRTEGRIYASPALMEGIASDASLAQVANVACLPGIVGASNAMPDIHWGYGFPIGGVAAFDAEEGIISPGGVGYDINCGVRLLASDLRREEIAGKLEDLTAGMFRNIPTGVGSRRKDLKLGPAECRKAAEEGARWAVSQGFGDREDLEFIEEKGALAGADFDAVSERAFERGRSQVGTLGSGNHFVEIGHVEEIYDEAVARAFGLGLGRVTALVHTGSRGFGYQICDETIHLMVKAAQKYGISLPDRQLCCAPIGSPEGRRYFAAMASAANFAFANRQIIAHWIRETFEEVLGLGPREHGLRLVYDVCHNIAKFEEHEVGGERRRLCVHRKGATRAFGPGHPEIPEAYRAVGQPVLVPGDMGRYSYVLAGCGMEETFGSACHGAGR
ncbi:MAG: RtcB family protein, partial [Planctomycetes bacterium]|nr:RtcB family protein [Planctomycetota bacterium]